MNVKVVARNILALVVGILVGGFLNGFLVSVGPAIVPLPDGADISTMDGLRDSMKLFTPINFLFPFMAHALGTLLGAFVTAKLAVSHHYKLAMGVGIFFLAGGSYMVANVGGPLWFNAVDLILAYLPMAWLGARLAGKR